MVLNLQPKLYAAKARPAPTSNQLAASPAEPIRPKRMPITAASPTPKVEPKRMPIMVAKIEAKSMPVEQTKIAPKKMPVEQKKIAPKKMPRLELDGAAGSSALRPQGVHVPPQLSRFHKKRRQCDSDSEDWGTWKAQKKE